MTIDSIIELATQAQLEEKWSESLKLWKQVDESVPSLQATFGMALAFENLQDFESAYDLYLGLVEKKPMSVRFRHGLARVCMALENYEQAKEQWESLAVLKPDVPKWTIQRVKCLVELRLIPLVLATLTQAVERWPESQVIQQFYKKNFHLYSDEYDDAEVSGFDLDSPQTTYADGCRWVKSRRHDLDGEEYSKLLSRFSVRWKDKALPKLWLAKDHFRKGRFSEALTLYCEVESTRENHQGDRYQILQCLIALDKFEKTQDRLRDYIHSSDLDLDLKKNLTVLLSMPESRNRAEALLAQMNAALMSHAAYSDDEQGLMSLGKIYASREPKRPLIANWNFDSEINSSSGASGDAVFILFTGYGKKMGSAPIKSIDYLVAGYDASLIMLKDHSGLLYQRGIPEIASDFETTISSLKNIISDMGAKRIFTIGSSGGCFGALRYGLELKAHNILLFSGPTNLSVEFLNEHGDYRARATIRKFNREFTDEELDMGLVLGKASYDSSIDAYYGVDNQHDASQALHISQFPNVRLHPIEGSEDHDTIGMAFTEGILNSHIEKLLSTSTGYEDSAGAS